MNMWEAVENKGAGDEKLEEGPLGINSSVIMEVDSDPDPHREISASMESTNELENQYISTCEALGEKSEVTDSLIEDGLLKLWTDFREGYEHKSFVNIDRCLESLLVCTAKLIFHVKYSKKVTAVPKRKLKETVNSCGEIIVDCPHQKTICLGIASFIENPWGAGKFTVVANTGAKSVLNISADASENLWNTEGWTMLETRVDFLVRLGEKCIDRVCSVLHVLATKGHQIYNIKQENNESKRCYDPYKFSYSRYLEYLQVYAIMMLKNCISIQQLSSWNKEVLLNVIEGLIEKTKCPDTKPLFPKFKFWDDVNSAVEFLVKNATWLALKSTDGEKLEELFGKWVQLCAEQLKSSPLDDILDNFDKITSTNCMYRIANAAITWCGQVEWIRPKFVEIYVRALTKDMNIIEALKMNQPPDKEKIRELERCLSLRYLELAIFFRDYPHTVKACLLTSFSLDPREDLLVCMFPRSVNGLYLSPDELTEEIRNLQTILSQIENHPAEDDLQLPAALCDDLENAIANPRYSGLFRWNSEEELLKHCTQLWNDKSVDVIENKKLEFVNVDYEKYKDLPSQYDPEDDGIEKGYRSGERALKRHCRAIANRKLKASKLTSKKSAAQRVLKSSKKGREKRMALNVRIGRPPKVKLGLERERKTKPAKLRPTKPARPIPEYKIHKRLPGKRELPNAEFYGLPWIANHFGKEMGFTFTEVFVKHVLPSTHELKEKSSRQNLKEKELLDRTRIAINTPNILNQQLVGDNHFRPEPDNQQPSNTICDLDFAKQGTCQIKSEGLEVYQPSSSHDIQPPPGHLPTSNQGQYEMQHLLRNVGNHWPSFSYDDHFPPKHAELQDMLLGNGLKLKNLLNSGMKKKHSDGADKLHIPKGKDCNNGMKTKKAKIAPEKKPRKNLKKVVNKGSNPASEPATMDKPEPNSDSEIKLCPVTATSIDEHEPNSVDGLRIPTHDSLVNDQSTSSSLQLANASSVESPTHTVESVPPTQEPGPEPICAFQFMGTYRKDEIPKIVTEKLNSVPSPIIRKSLGDSVKASPTSDQLKKWNDAIDTVSEQPGKTKSESQAGSNRAGLQLTKPLSQPAGPAGLIVARSLPKTYQNRKKRLVVIQPWNNPPDVDTIGGATQSSSAHDNTEKSHAVINYPSEVALCKASSVFDSTKNETSRIPESPIPPNVTKPQNQSETSYPLENSRKSIPIPPSIFTNHFQATNEQVYSKPERNQQSFSTGNPLDNLQAAENPKPNLKLEVTGSLEPYEKQRSPGVMVEPLTQHQSTDMSIVPVSDNSLTNQDVRIDKGGTTPQELPEGNTYDSCKSLKHTHDMPKDKDNTSASIVHCQNEYEHKILEQSETLDVVSTQAKKEDSVAENIKLKPCLGKESGVVEVGTTNISNLYASSDLPEQSKPVTVETTGHTSCTRDGNSSKAVSAPDSISAEQLPSSKSQATCEKIRSKDGTLPTKRYTVSLNLHHTPELARFCSVIAKKEVKIDQLKTIHNEDNPLSKHISSNNGRDCSNADTPAKSNAIGNPDYARSACSNSTCANDASQTLQEEKTTISLAVKQINAHQDIESAPNSAVSTIEVSVSEANKHNPSTNVTTDGTKTVEENSLKNKTDSDHDNVMISIPSPEENIVDPHVELRSLTTVESSVANDNLIHTSTLFGKTYNANHSGPFPPELGDQEKETNEQHLIPTPPPLTQSLPRTDPWPDACTEETLVASDEILRNTYVCTKDGETETQVVDGLHEMSLSPQTCNYEKDLSNDESSTAIVPLPLDEHEVAETSCDPSCEQVEQFIEDVCESDPFNDNQADDRSDQADIVIFDGISIEEPGLRCKTQLAPVILDSENVMEEAPTSEILPIIQRTVALNDILEEACADKVTSLHAVTEENVASTSCDAEITSSNSLGHNDVRTSNITSRDTEAKAITVSEADPLSEGSAVAHKNVTAPKKIVRVRSHIPSDDTILDISASTDSENSSDEEPELNGLLEGKFNDKEVERVDSKNENKRPRSLTPVAQLEEFINTYLKRKAKRPYEDEKIKVAQSVVKHVEKFGGGLRNIIACYVEVTPLADEAIPPNVRSQLNPVKRSSRIKGKKEKTVEAIKNVFKTEDKEDSSSSRSSSPEIEIVKEICNKTKTNKLQVRNLNSHESTSNETTRFKNENITGATRGFRPTKDTSNFVQGPDVNGEVKDANVGNVKWRRSNVESPYDYPNKFARSTSNHRSPRPFCRAYRNASRSGSRNGGDPDFRPTDDCNSCTADDSDAVKECVKSDLENGQEILEFEPFPEEMTVDDNDPLAIENEGIDEKSELITLDDSESSSACIEIEGVNGMRKKRRLTDNEDTEHSPQILEPASNTAPEPTEEVLSLSLLKKSQEVLSPASTSRSGSRSGGDLDFKPFDDCNSCSANESDSIEECAKSGLGNGQEILEFEPVPEEMTVYDNDPLAIENEGNDKKSELTTLDDSGSFSASIEIEGVNGMGKKRRLTDNEDTEHSPRILEPATDTAPEPIEEVLSLLNKSQEVLSPASTSRSGSRSEGDPDFRPTDDCNSCTADNSDAVKECATSGLGNDQEIPEFEPVPEEMAVDDNAPLAIEIEGNDKEAELITLVDSGSSSVRIEIEGVNGMRKRRRLTDNEDTEDTPELLEPTTNTTPEPTEEVLSLSLLNKSQEILSPASTSRSGSRSESDPDFRPSDDCNSCTADDSDSVKECATSGLGNDQEILEFEAVPEEMTVDDNAPLAIEIEGNDKEAKLITVVDGGSSSANIEMEGVNGMRKKRRLTDNEDTEDSPEILEPTTNTTPEPTEEVLSLSLLNKSQEVLSPASTSRSGSRSDVDPDFRPSDDCNSCTADDSDSVKECATSGLGNDQEIPEFEPVPEEMTVDDNAPLAIEIEGNDKEAELITLVDGGSSSVSIEIEGGVSRNTAPEPTDEVLPLSPASTSNNDLVVYLPYTFTSPKNQSPQISDPTEQNDLQNLTPISASPEIPKLTPENQEFERSWLSDDEPPTLEREDESQSHNSYPTNSN